MSAPVRIEAEAWSDLRFATLARLMGFADAHHALIKTAVIWSWQAEHYSPETPTYVVDEDTVESALGAGGAAALVRSRLAESEPGGLRIRGAAGRIEWLWQRRQASKAGGEATKRKRSNKEEPDGRPEAPASAGPTPEPNASPLVLALVLDPEDQNSPSARAIPPTGVQEVQDQQPPAGGAGPAADPAWDARVDHQVYETYRQVVPDTGPRADHPRDPTVPAMSPSAPSRVDIAGTQLAAKRAQPAPNTLTPPGESAWQRRKRWWDAMHAADARIRAAGVEPNAPTLPKNFAGENERNLAACERQLVDAGFTPDEVDAKMLHVVAVAEAEALRPDNRSRKWFKPALIWDPRQANRAVDTSVDEAGRARPAPGSRAAAPPAPTKRPERRAPDPVRSPEDLAAMLAQAAAAAAAPERGQEIALLPTSDLVKRFGGDSARAITGPDQKPDENQRRTRKATTA